MGEEKNTLKPNREKMEENTQAEPFKQSRMFQGSSICIIYLKRI